MAELVGFESGYQLALDEMQARAGQQQKMRLQEQEMQMNSLKMQKLLAEQNMEEQTRRLVAQSFSAGAQERSDVQVGTQNAMLVGGMQRAGAALMATNPKEGRRFLEEARSLQYQNSLERRELQQQQQRQQEAIGSYMATINSQQDLDVALPELAKLGYVVPKQFRTYNPLAKEFFKFQALRSMGSAKALDYQLRMQEAESKEENRVSQEELRKARQVEIESNNIRRREKVVQQATKSAQTTKFQGIEADIAAVDEDWDNLSPSDQLAYGNWARQRARGLMVEAAREGETLTEEEALNQALEQGRQMVQPNPKSGLFGKSHYFNAKAARSTEQPATQQEWQEGAVYVDPQTKVRAMWKGGKWVRVN